MRVAGWMVALAIGWGVSLAALAANADYQAGAQAFEQGAHARAAQIWQPLANANDPRAQYGLGLLYHNGWGMPARDALRAQHWYTLAAERGHPGAQYNLAVMRDTGDGVPRDSAQAAFWYAEAARQGLPAAAYNLALMTLAGDGLRRDPAQAVRWLEHARPLDRARLIAALPQARVTVRGARLRAGPRLDAPIQAALRRGESLRVFTQKGDWSEVWQINDNGPDRVGWMATRLIEGEPRTRPVRLARFELGALTGLDARRGRRASHTQRARATTTGEASSVEGSRRLLRNSGWLTSFEGLDLGAAPGRPERVATDRVNVRAAPSAQAAVLTQVERDTRLRVTGRRAGWRRVLLPDAAGSGWVAAFLLADLGDPPTADTPGREVRVGAAVVNLRAGPSTHTDVRAQLRRGERVRVVDSRAGWREVVLADGETHGWIAAFLLAGETEAAAPRRAAIGESGG